MKESRLLLGAEMKDTPPVVHWGNVVDMVTRLAEQEDGPSERRLPEGISAKDYVRHLVQNGALHEQRDGSMIITIPRFQTWTIENAGLGAA